MLATFEPTTFAPELNIEGLTLRNWRDDSDYEKMLCVLYADKHSQGLEEAIPLDEFKTHIESLPHSNLRRDVFLLERDGEVIAYKNLRGYPEASGTYCYNHHGFVLPEWKGRGIGRAMIRHSEQVAREIARNHPANAPKFFQVFIQSKQTDLANLLEQEGYATERYFYEMLRPNLDNLPDYELPTGIEVRPVQPEHMHMIWRANVEMFKEHWGEADHGEDDYERWLKRAYIQPKFWHVAWDRDRIVGLVLNFVDEADNAEYNRKRGQTDDIGTLKEYRGRGIAQALIVRGLRQFRDLGYTEAALDVDSENSSGALRLYEKLGYRPSKTILVYRKSL